MSLFQPAEGCSVCRGLDWSRHCSTQQDWRD